MAQHDPKWVDEEIQRESDVAVQHSKGTTRARDQRYRRGLQGDGHNQSDAGGAKVEVYDVRIFEGTKRRMATISAKQNTKTNGWMKTETREKMGVNVIQYGLKGERHE